MNSDLSKDLGWKVLEARVPSEWEEALKGREGEEGQGSKPEVGVVPEKFLFLPGAGLAKIIYKLRYTHTYVYAKMLEIGRRRFYGYYCRGLVVFLNFDFKPHLESLSWQHKYDNTRDRGLCNSQTLRQRVLRDLETPYPVEPDRRSV